MLGPCSPTLYEYELEYLDSLIPSMNGPEEGWRAIAHDDCTDGLWKNLRPGGSDLVLFQGSGACGGSWGARIFGDGGITSSISHNHSQLCDSYTLLRSSCQFEFLNSEYPQTVFQEVSLDGGLAYDTVGDRSSVSLDRNHGICHSRSVIFDTSSQLKVDLFGSNVKLRVRNSGKPMESDGGAARIARVHLEGYMADGDKS